MLLMDFSASGWETWDVTRRPLIREGMPVLIDNDLRFEDGPGRPRPTVMVNRWLRELPVSGAPAQRTWRNYAGAVRDWMEFLDDRGVQLFGDRADLRAALSMYAEHRLAGEPAHRWDRSTWSLHVQILSGFYRWASDESLVTATPFTFRSGVRMADGMPMKVQRNLAKLRSPHPHTTIKYLERDFTRLLVRALAGLGPDGEPDTRYERPREGARNSSMVDLVLSSGLRRQEFTHLTIFEIPPLPQRPTQLPIEFPLGHAITKGQKSRQTWVHYDQLAALHQYIDLDRAASADGFVWRPPAKLGAPLLMEEPDWEGARINGERRSWRTLRPQERLRLVTREGQSPIVGLQTTGEPFVDWATVLSRTSKRIRNRYEPRFPLASPHWLRHSMAMHTLEDLVKGYYEQAARVAARTDDDAAMALYLSKSDPMMILRDLLGHQSVTTTQTYVARIDTSRIFRKAYQELVDCDGKAAGPTDGRQI
ncbi:tyrosine-type recombinase/integrase [Nocardia sp. NPDC059229]|uniref:tyrosine-type recombinase/integrase n=1 Tax=Nocardia sp. NPDC059229 TaxID=3346778 RepID=UPI003696F103